MSVDNAFPVVMTNEPENMCSEVSYWNSLERKAAWIVEHASKTTTTPRDTNHFGGTSGQPDFTLRDGNGCEIGLPEVTSSTDGARQSTVQGLRKNAGAFRGNPTRRRKIAGSRFEWVLHMRTDARLTPLWSQLEDVLDTIEQQAPNGRRHPTRQHAACSGSPTTTLPMPMRPPSNGFTTHSRPRRSCTSRSTPRG